MILQAQNFFTILLLILLSVSCLEAQTSLQPKGQSSLPGVFVLGEFDTQYESIMPKYKTLLEACSGDMEGAFDKLTGMMAEMEAYAELSGYDLKDINAWMHFFWDKNGRIDHIGFHLKPNSRNVDVDELKNFLNEFASNYRFPHSFNQPFAHYSSFSFPLFYQSDKTAKAGRN